MSADAFDQLLMLLLNTISDACDRACLRISDRIIIERDARRQVARLIDDDVARARVRAMR